LHLRVCVSNSLVRKGVGSNPTLVSLLFILLPFTGKVLLLLLAPCWVIARRDETEWRESVLRREVRVAKLARGWQSPELAGRGAEAPERAEPRPPGGKLRLGVNPPHLNRLIRTTGLPPGIPTNCQLIGSTRAMESSLLPAPASILPGWSASPSSAPLSEPIHDSLAHDFPQLNNLTCVKLAVSHISSRAALCLDELNCTAHSRRDGRRARGWRAGELTA